MKAKLINEKLPFEMVEFDFNPDSLKYTRGSDTTTRPNASPAGMGSTPSILLKAPPKSLAGFRVGSSATTCTTAPSSCTTGWIPVAACSAS